MIIPKDSLFGLTILVAGVIALIKFNKISTLFYPFIFCVWAAGLNEILSYLLWKTGHFTTINNNIYVLAESVLFTLFFRNTGIFEKFPKLPVTLMAGFIFLWSWENFYFGKITYVSSWFRIVYSFIIVLMSITTVNRLLILDLNEPLEASPPVIKNPVLLICIGSVAYFTFKVLVEIFWLYGLNAGKEFRNNVYEILAYVNLAANLIYALAILWAPPKQPYMTRY